MFLSARVHEGAEMCALVPLSNLRKTLALCQPCPPASPKTSSPPSSVALRSPRSTSCSHVQLVPLFSTTWTAACQAPLSMGSSRQEHWSGSPLPSPKRTIERKKVKSLSRVRLFATPWTVANQAPPSMEFSRREYWSGLPR